MREGSAGAAARSRADWERLGESDPLWAVLMKPDTKNGGWDREEFLATGRAEVAASLDHLRELGSLPLPGRALDFGCGAGRTAIALAATFEEVTGLDVSPGMLRAARSLDTSGRCRFVLSERDDLAGHGDGSFDLVYSSLVLQHLPPDLGWSMLAELARVTAPGGALVVQLTTRPTRSAKGLLFRYAPWPLIRLGQRLVLRYPAPMRMQAFDPRRVRAVLAAAGLEVLDVVEDTTYGGHWVYHRYFAVRPS
ncbi:class I SAM-dependent methyltransferase [Phycicoccus sp. MAQZ13P-2]|uniref:class I SAM-dependent methyltransferase n=1 Tax=Phycicoccus mangrovi TaxID=2840470 RepID=UPI001C005F18|nr:class I SAM-dependent methyltransferase [Phycicoccus mangrovi]MBT9257026.1 class I SAM-dependent methyltransferase [Phycicoccus mangrovi]MBT9275484.1 class I SAM-dependent methyltransferase [Phycicoccus mangrovi]